LAGCSGVSRPGESVDSAATAAEEEVASDAESAGGGAGRRIVRGRGGAPWRGVPTSAGDAIAAVVAAVCCCLGFSGGY
jgi:hypothetical protein